MIEETQKNIEERKTGSGEGRYRHRKGKDSDPFFLSETGSNPSFTIVA
jgi:hypothetical protein